MDKRIFISYSRKDFEAVKVIKAEIERATGEECWMDMEGIPYDSPDFVEVIAKAIEAADVFLFMLSEHSQNSRKLQSIVPMEMSSHSICRVLATILHTQRVSIGAHVRLCSK